MKSFIDKLKCKYCKVKEKIRNFFSKPLKYLDSGKWGGNIICLIFATVFFENYCVENVACGIPVMLLYIFSFFAVALSVEILNLLIKIIFSVGRRNLIYIIITAGLVMSTSIDASRGRTAFLPIALGILVGIVSDLVGRILWNIFVCKKYKIVYGYFVLFPGCVFIVFFIIYLNSAGFGKNLKTEYLSIYEEVYADEVHYGFDEYLQNGDYTVGTLIYGPGIDDDIVTGTSNISYFASRKGLSGKVMDYYFDYDLTCVPIAGKIYFPKEGNNFPVVFIAHGNHEYSVDSYLGYDYLGEYLASNGYVVVSVDENCCNKLSGENDARAVLMLENIKEILEENRNEKSMIYGKINPDEIALIGHSRGGEMAATACLFNNLDVYPDNGNVDFSYKFNIKSVVAIAPTVDQYLPADKSVKIKDVNYLLIHGSNDQDVINVMGEKQYNNIEFTPYDKKNEEYCKASVFVMGANHGQFNSEWGQYDLGNGMDSFLNTANFLEEESQQYIAKAYIRVFLDKTLIGGKEYEDLLWNSDKYLEYLPQTVYQSSYETNRFTSICSFDNGTNIIDADMKYADVDCYYMGSWGEEIEQTGGNNMDSNYVMFCSWSDTNNALIDINIPTTDMEDKIISLRMADKREDYEGEPEAIDYKITIYDTYNRKAYCENPIRVYPSIAVQLYKDDVITDNYEYKHQLQTVLAFPEEYTADIDFDFSRVKKIEISFPEMNSGRIIIDDVGWHLLEEFE